ncbi:hypothetical protein M407DRAFT_31313 [Tulasnella calospora MUT 4182]|uniref:Uncharacterized protein n=1 Tax=Tulasnella calospora MUT 4182 TaxID=1051891 RepID=A0A0C3Q6P7_9AGAM|nr:hypothetical protein M407DRAFT_31313 [Tulasnella calospora MUT 4182]
MTAPLSLLRRVGNRELDSTELAELYNIAYLLQNARTAHQAEAAAQSLNKIADRLRVERAHTLLEKELDPILDHLPLCDVVTVGQASRALQAAVKGYIQRRIRGLLSGWFKHPDYFRKLLHSSRGVLSGSTVLAFILGLDWGQQDLDIYIPRSYRELDASYFLRQLQNYLTEVEGYKVESVQTVKDVAASLPPGELPLIQQTDMDTDVEGGFDFDYDNGQVRTVVKLSLENPNSMNPTTIDLVEGAHPGSPVAPISRFHTTFVMNYISSSSITVLYPQQTFIMQGVLNERIDVTRPKQIAWMEKYQSRGFKIITNPSTMDMPCGPACRSIWRRTDDKGSMVVSFDDPIPGALPEYKWTLAKHGRPLKPGKCSNVLCHRGVKGEEWPSR